MKVKRLKLINFRNYKALDIDFTKNYNIIYGDNAQGKTNIIESIFLCASGRSHRTSKDSELIKIGEKNFFIRVEVKLEEYDISIEIGYDGKNKKIKINGMPIKRIGDLMGNLRAVIFSPEDLMIIKEGPSERRRLIDITLSQLKPVYFYNLQQYQKILNQRNSLLKAIQNNRDLIDTLDIWNENIVNAGAKVIYERKKFIEKLNKYSGINHKKLTNVQEELKLKYKPSIKCENYESIDEIKECFLKSLDRLKNTELTLGTTMCGPQRDDMDITVNNKQLRIYGSQGQQRTAILSIKLATIDVIEEDTGQKPILLLDDVLSELDKKRQTYLFQTLVDIQTFITTTEKDIIDEKYLEDKKFFKVEKGEVFV